MEELLQFCCCCCFVLNQLMSSLKNAYSLQEGKIMLCIILSPNQYYLSCFRKYKVILYTYGSITDFYISPGIECLRNGKSKREKMLYYAKLSPIFSQLASFYFWLPKNRELLSTFTKISVLWSSGIIRNMISIVYLTYTPPSVDLYAQLNKFYTAQLPSH